VACLAIPRSATPEAIANEGYLEMALVRQQWLVNQTGMASKAGNKLVAKDRVKNSCGNA